MSDAKTQQLTQALQTWSEAVAPALDDFTRNEANLRPTDCAAIVQRLRKSAADLKAVLTRQVDLLRDVIADDWPSSLEDSDLVKRLLPFGHEAVILLANLLDEGEEVEIRRIAAFYLGLVGPAASDVIPELISAFRARDVLLRRQAAVALGKMGSKALMALPALIEALTEAHPSHHLIDALMAIAPHDERTVCALVDMLQNCNPTSRLAALRALDRIGAPAISVSPTLVDELDRFPRLPNTVDSELANEIIARLRDLARRSQAP